ncbi:uncharacterized protein METZ01_LOCUS284042 [marine metagenome]|uniref:Uncharacterized protein n=1 Tax=marine metagenome TaxID=408172 RepID=A0A382L2J2_9ZZZZ
MSLTQFLLFQIGWRANGHRLIEWSKHKTNSNIHNFLLMYKYLI